jgi:UDPglucose 6-dehydrogenase
MAAGKETMRISIFGMGYVGTVSAAGLCEKGHTVICVDTEDKQMIPFLASYTGPSWRWALEN